MPILSFNVINNDIKADLILMLFDNVQNKAQTGRCIISAGGTAMCLITRKAPELGVNQRSQRSKLL